MMGLQPDLSNCTRPNIVNPDSLSPVFKSLNNLNKEEKQFHKKDIVKQTILRLEKRRWK
jgi:hypothetical protein